MPSTLHNFQKPPGRLQVYESTTSDDGLVEVLKVPQGYIYIFSNMVQDSNGILHGSMTSQFVPKN